VISTKDEAIAILDSYNSESVDFVKEYKDSIDHLKVIELRWPDFVEVDPYEEIVSMRHSYLMYGIGEDYLEHVEDLDKIYEALCFVNNEPRKDIRDENYYQIKKQCIEH